MYFEENVGRPLVGLLNGNDDSLLFCSGDPQGASLHFQQGCIFNMDAFSTGIPYILKIKIIKKGREKMIISGYHFLQKAQNDVMIPKIDGKNSKINKKMMFKNPLFKKIGRENTISQSCDQIFKYQNVKELQNNQGGFGGGGEGFDSPIYIYYNLFK